MYFERFLSCVISLCAVLSFPYGAILRDTFGDKAQELLAIHDWVTSVAHSAIAT